MSNNHYNLRMVFKDTDEKVLKEWLSALTHYRITHGVQLSNSYDNLSSVLNSIINEIEKNK